MTTNPGEVYDIKTISSSETKSGTAEDFNRLVFDYVSSMEAHTGLYCEVQYMACQSMYSHVSHSAMIVTRRKERS